LTNQAKQRNRARCEACGDIIESTYRHDFKMCKGGHIFVDGGQEYLRCGFDIPSNFTRLYDDGREENLGVEQNPPSEEYSDTEILNEVEDVLPLLESDPIETTIAEAMTSLKDRLAGVNSKTAYQQRVFELLKRGSAE
jgi:hypothetical protein